MLASLTIQNYALISRLEIDFSNGFSVMTGETGAGKSIILGAISLILGQRADSKSIKQNEDKCLIEGVFNISSYQLQSFFEERELEYDATHCILRRELWSSGKSRAFINDTPVSLNDLKELGSHLIDIHSQHQNLMLGDNRFQLQVLDVLAGNKKLIKQYQSAYYVYASIGKQLKELKQKMDQDASEEDYLRFQFGQLEEANLKPGEQAELEAESETLSHIEDIKNGIYRIYQTLSDDDRGVISALKDSLNTSQGLVNLYPHALEMTERLQTAYLDLKDLSQELGAQQEKLELDPERLQWVNERLDLLYSLQKKHKVDSVEALIDLYNEISKKLQEINRFDEQLAELQKESESALQNVWQLAGQLTVTRKNTATRLEQELVRKVSVLGMPNMQFSCEMTLREQPDATGVDDICFLFSANKNGVLKPVAQTASGGEISRLMLGIKALIAGAMALPSIIFDEIDTGVSGEVSDKMGRIMHELGKVMQVIAITHLPQIAAQGKNHYFVYKNDTQDTTETHIRKLSGEERIREIAQMLSGTELTEAALEHAKLLLK